ncbi:ABC transporter ATP-binding protein [Longispora fulva]|uniref:ABC-2 type transport system ATP-binding protein n=1 Tax=Longispora fulva TaxID=619741 RepID=A0A8J7GJY4_9ACTN|nr:ABC-2 type transport system ATP-binding protein [Longispora fulva]
MLVDAAIHVQDLRKTYKSTATAGESNRRGLGPRLAAVDGLDLTVLTGEIFALLGPNGAGKTTTVEILEGFRQRDAGQVSVLGVDPARPTAAWRARIGVVLQSTGEFEELTVEEVVRHFSGYYPNPDDPNKLIELVGLADKRRARARTLSGGQRRRLDVALGVIGRPELLFLDEPTTGFDPQARQEFWGLIRGLAETGTTIVLTTHYLEEAEALADRVGVISAGRLVAVDTPAALGDRANRPATVRWSTPDGPRSAETAEPTAFVTALAAELGGEIPRLTVTRPTLEDVYLEMIFERRLEAPFAERLSDQEGQA